MTTYANIKLGEIFALYGNPFTRGTCKKNIKAKIFSKYYKKVNFEEILYDDIQSKGYLEGNSKIDFINKKDDGILSLQHFFNNNNNNRSTSYIKLSHLFPNNSSSKIQLNTDTFSVSSYKKRTQQELIKKTGANVTSEENNTKMSSIFPKKTKINTGHISHISQFIKNINNN